MSRVWDVALPERLSVRFTPNLLRSLTAAWQCVGRISAIDQYSLSHYAHQRCSVDGRRERLHHLVCCADQRAGREEIQAVLGGVKLVGIRSEIGPRILAAGAISVALESAARGEQTTPTTCAAYVEIAHHPERHGLAQWQRYSGARRAHLLDLVAEGVRVHPTVEAIYAKVGEAEVCRDPLLRAGALWLLLRSVYRHRLTSVALAGIVYHELVVGGLDPSQSFSFPPRDTMLHFAVISYRFEEMLDTGDLTEMLEAFVSSFFLAMSAEQQRIEGFARELRHLPKAAITTPDDLDRALFDAIRVLGHPTARELLALIASPPPLRTVQRRLQGLVKRGLIEKTGARKDARYRLAEGF